MKLKTGFALLLAFLVTTAEARTLAPDAIAQVETSGGFTAPSALNTSGIEVKADGTVLHYSFVAIRGGARKKVTVIATLSPAKVADLLQAISDISEGELVDEDPSAPSGADFPQVSFEVRTANGPLLIAERRSDARSYILKDSSALLVRDLLEALSQLGRFTQPSEFIF